MNFSLVILLGIVEFSLSEDDQIRGSMSFAPVNVLFGEAHISSRNVSLTEHTDCLYFPFSKDTFFDRDNRWGLYESSGDLIENAAYRRGPDLELVGQSTSVPRNVSDRAALTEDLIYFGPLIPHYGHFVLTSLARAWYLTRPDVRRGRKLLCHSDHPPAEHFARSFMGPLIRGLGLDEGDFIAPAEPIQVKRVTVPSPAFIEQKEVFAEFLEPMHVIGSSLLSHGTIEALDRTAYLSKSKMPRGAVSYVSNEKALEDILETGGCDIFYPEQMDLSDQIRLFSTYKNVMGFVGSALHSHIFVRNPPNIIGISMAPYVNSNVILLDRLNNVESSYFYPEGNIDNCNVEGYGISKTIKDPYLMAKDLLDVAATASGNIYAIPWPPTQKSAAQDLQIGSSNMTPFSYFLDNTGRPIHKSGHYFFAYQRHFSKYVGQPCTLLEIGAGNGGSSQMWKKWLGPLARIVSIDINPICQQFADEQVEVRIGSQSDPAFLSCLVEEFGAFDIVLDDGSHHMTDVVASFRFLYERIAVHGVYMIEDMHTAYWENYGGGLQHEKSMIELFKQHIDKLNAIHIHNGTIPVDDFTHKTLAMTAYDSILVFEKTPYQNKIMRIIGDEALRVNY